MTTDTHNILLVDDEPDILELLSMTLSRMGHITESAGDVSTALEMLMSRPYDLCLTDLRLPDGSGIEIVKYIDQTLPNLPVAVISAHGNMQTAIESLKAGAFDFISKPIDLGQFRGLIDNALSLQAPNRGKLKDASAQLYGKSAAIEKIRQQIKKLSRSMAPVHISGESGTGKELVAQLIHDQGPHSGMPFIAVNCSAIPGELMESEFFGHVKGSFTGASSNKQGLFEAAENGTLFLDEIADLPLTMQAKLLRAIQERAIRPVGGHNEIPINCRILSATHKSLSNMVSTGEFRQDLFYRVNVIDLVVPPLREHREDIEILVTHILTKIAGRSNFKELPRPNQKAMKKLENYEFPGNIRELENILERATALCEDEITPDDLSLEYGGTKKSITDNLTTGQTLDDYLESVERHLIMDALEKSGKNKTKAAQALGISFRSFRYKLKKLGIN